MTVYRTYLSILEKGVSSYGSSTLLKIPQYSENGSEFKGWKDITYKQFQNDVEAAARYWYHELSQKGWTGRSVVGLWLKGTSYLDLLHIWGVMRAGYIPQLISLRMTSPQVVYELLEKAGAVALLFEPAFEGILKENPLPSFPAGDFFSASTEALLLPKQWTSTSADDITMILHTSGSTSGIPKLVPFTARWLDCNILKIRSLVSWNREEDKQEVITSGGSFCHLATMSVFICYMDRGGAVVLPTSIPYSTDELRRIDKECGLTSLFMFSSFLHKLFVEARSDESLVKFLQRMWYVGYGGLALESADEAWGRSQGMTLANVFASTEVGVMAQSRGESVAEGELLEMLPGSAYEFVPISNKDDEEEFAGQTPLVELVVLPESGDCPDPSLRDEDGKYHTGDLFLEVKPGKYLSKGRNDDWIKMEISLRCDTKSIENNALETCGKDLISVACVVGAGKPSPVLIVEPADGVKVDTEEDIAGLKAEIFTCITPFHERRYVHERIDDPKFIMVVPKGALPRTGAKGNVQRKMAEKVFKTQLDGVY